MKKFLLPEELKRLARGCGFPLYVVGGACRDFLAGLSYGDDWDICAPVSAERFLEAAESYGFVRRAVYANTGTVKLKYGERGYEFACFRTDEYVRGHSPASVEATDDIVLDAKRRDFKCNAVYYDVAAEKFVDPLGGIADIKNCAFDCVRDSKRVFAEDGLRLMRLCRQCAQTGFAPTAECLEGARENAFRIEEISPERIWAELDLILHADRKHGLKGAQYSGLKLLEECGVMAKILPELQLGKGMEQRADFHSHDVLEHSLRCVLYAPDGIRLAALLHDVGKPFCKVNYGNFHAHEVIGADLVVQICSRLRIPKTTCERVRRLVACHMYDLDCRARESKVRRFIVSNGDILEDLLDLKQADFSACKDDVSEAPSVKKWKKIYGDMLEEGAPMNLKQLAVNGNDLINCGIFGGQIGKVLDELLYECATGALPNKREKLLTRAVKLAKELK